MAEYAIYCLDNGVRLIAAEWIDAANDEHALMIAGGMRQGTRREVWEGLRLVGKIEIDSGDVDSKLPNAE